MKKSLLFGVKVSLISLASATSAVWASAQVPIVRPAEVNRVPIVRPNQTSPATQNQSNDQGITAPPQAVPIIRSAGSLSPSGIGTGVNPATSNNSLPPIVSAPPKTSTVPAPPMIPPTAPPAMGLSSFANANPSLASSPAAPNMSSQPSMNRNSTPMLANEPWINPSVPGYGAVDQGCGCDGGSGSGSTCDGCSDSACTSCGGIGLGRIGRPTLGLRRAVGCGPFCLLGGVANCGFDDCGYVSPAERYFQADALYWRRSDGGIIGTTFGGVSNNDWNWGWRGTLGWRQDEIIGHELTYFGFQPFTDTVRQTSPAGLIDARFFPAGGYNFALLDSFYDAEVTRQTMQSRLHSVGLSRVRFGWDVVKTSFGMRYIWFDDQYQLASQSGADLGLFQSKAINNLFGPDLGLELLYDVGRRISFSGKIKGGLFINFNRYETNVANNSTQLVAARVDRTDWAGSLELGANAYFKLGRHARLRGGYDGFWLFDVASVTENYPAFVTPLTGQTPGADRDAKFHGVSFGLELFR